MNVSLNEVAALVNGVVIGDEKINVTALSPIDNIQEGSLVFAEGKDHFITAEKSAAAALLVKAGYSSNVKPIIQVANPFKAFIQLLNHFHPPVRSAPGIHPTAVVAPDARIGNHCVIGPYVVVESGASIGDRCILKGHAYIGRNVTIGEDTVIHPHVTVYDESRIGQRVSIHASTVIGSDGFGYIFVDGQHLKMPHIGSVIIEDDVEIGANAVIDRASMGSTVIGAGTKIDNLVQVAHSVKLGKHNILCAFTGIAGSTVTGDYVTCAANVGVSDHVRIDNGVILGARAGVPPKKHLTEGNVYLGSPARPRDKAIENELSVARIPLMRKNVRSLSDKVNEIQKRLDKLESNE